MAKKTQAQNASTKPAADEQAADEQAKLATSLGFDADDEDVQPEKPAARDNDGIPYCTRHHCRMKQVSGGSGGTKYYACPVTQPGEAKCDQRAQMVKTDIECVVPPRPQRCQRCEKIDGVANAPFMELDTHASDAAKVVLACPKCGRKSGAMAQPQLAAAELKRRRATHKLREPNVGDR